MASSGVGSVLLGWTLIAGGIGLFLLALQSQAKSIQRAPTRTAIVEEPKPAASPLLLPSGASSRTSGSDPAVGAVSAKASGVTPVVPAASVLFPASSASASFSETNEHGTFVFHFPQAEVVLAKGEMVRLTALGGRLTRHDNVRVTIEGFADAPGNDEKSKALGRRRALIVRQTLGDVGVALDHMIYKAVDIAADPSVTSAVRIRTEPPLPETESR